MTDQSTAQLPASALALAPANRLIGKVALITGGGGAIGLETAGRLLQEGARVSLIDISREALDRATTHLQETILANDPAGRSAKECILTIQADVTSEPEVAAYTERTVSHFGRLDTAFLNAGISYSSTSIFDTTAESYDRIMNANVKSGRFCTSFSFFVAGKE